MTAAGGFGRVWLVGGAQDRMDRAALGFPIGGRQRGHVEASRCSAVGGGFLMKRLLVVVCVLIFTALVPAGAANAAQPFKERVSTTPVTLNDACSFPVLLEPAAPDVINTFVFNNGKFFVTGPQVLTATNLDSGKSVRINISGTLSFVSKGGLSGTLTLTGPTLLEGGVINAGRSVFKFDASGVLVSSSVVGRQTDLCAELSGP